MGAISGLSTSAASGISNPKTEIVSIALANTEQSFTFRSGTKKFSVHNSGSYIAKLSYQVTESGTEYIPIYPGSSYEVFGIAETSVTIYVQSPGQLNLHIESWT